MCVLLNFTAHVLYCRYMISELHFCPCLCVQLPLDTNLNHFYLEKLIYAICFACIKHTLYNAIFILMIFFHSSFSWENKLSIFNHQNEAKCKTKFQWSACNYKCINMNHRLYMLLRCEFQLIGDLHAAKMHYMWCNI